jgi:hypothetical protein
MTIRGYTFPVPEKKSTTMIDTLKKGKTDEVWSASWRGDSWKMKGPMLLVNDTRTAIAGSG